jgi:hypothetical protein
MLEMILKPIKIQHHPILMGLVAFISVSIAIILSWKIFPESSSILLITFTIIPAIPLMVKLIENEEYSLTHSKNIFRKHKIINIYGWYFGGLVLAFMIWYLILPPAISDNVFSEQMSAIYDFRGPSGFAVYRDTILDMKCDAELVERYGGKHCEVVDFDKDYIEEYLFYENEKPSFLVELGPLQSQGDNYKPIEYKKFLLKHIFSNNIRILLFALLTSFIFGAGALFVITWNASIVGVFMGHMVYNLSALELAGFFIHGVPEFLSFFLAAIAGGVLSVAIIKHKPSDKDFKIILKDFIILCTISIVILLIAAALEVYI